MSTLWYNHLPVAAIPLSLFAERMPVGVLGVLHQDHGFDSTGINVEIDLPDTIPKSHWTARQERMSDRPEFTPQ